MFGKKLDMHYVIFEITTKCNLKCKYCYNYWKSTGIEYIEEKEEISPLKTLKQFCKQANVTNVTFTGGEPILRYEDLIDCIIYSKLRGKRATVITNGTLLDEKKVKELTSLKVDNFETTINSYKKDIHETINEVQGSFDKSVNAIKLLKEYNSNVTVPIVITKYNYMGIERTLEFIYDLGITNIMLNRYNIGGKGVHNPKELVLDKLTLNETFKKADEFARKKNLKLYSLVCTPNCLLNPKDFTNIVFSHCNPKEMTSPVTLDAKGGIRYCNHSPVEMGNIYKDKLEDIFKSEYMEKWRNIEPEYCKNCVENIECRYGCRAASEQMGYTLAREDPVLEYGGIYEKVN